MNTSKRKRVAAAICGWVVAAAPLATAFGATATVIATGLVNPKGIDQSPGGALYVAEAGNGGSDCTSVTGACFGLTGAVSRVDPTGILPAVRVISGLPSIYSGSPRLAVGPNDVSVSRYGAPTVVMGLGGNLAVRDKLGPAGANLGKVLRLDLDEGTVKPVADISAFEQTSNPAGGDVDSNPYGIEAQPGEWAVADAGGNSLVSARPNGKTQLLAVFPSQMAQVPGAPPGTMLPSQAVPTSVTKGPDGYYYVGTLTGFPFATGAAKVWRVPPWGGTPELCASGFTTIVDVAFDPYSHLYVLEISSGLRFPPGPVLEYPGGVVIGLDGAAYVTNKTLSSGGGEVLRIALDD